MGPCADLCLGISSSTVLTASNDAYMTASSLPETLRNSCAVPCIVCTSLNRYLLLVAYLLDMFLLHIRLDSKKPTLHSSKLSDLPAAELPLPCETAFKAQCSSTFQ